MSVAGHECRTSGRVDKRLNLSRHRSRIMNYCYYITAMSHTILCNMFHSSRHNTSKIRGIVLAICHVICLMSHMSLHMSHVSYVTSYVTSPYMYITLQLATVHIDRIKLFI